MKISAEERTRRMGSENIPKLIILMSLPGIAGNVSSALYNIIARWFVGNFVGKDALGALALLFPLSNLTSALSLIATIGGAALVSISLGRNDRKAADVYFTNILLYTALCGMILSFLYGFFAPQLVNFCGADQTSALFEPAVIYTRITAAGQIFLMFNQSLACVIRAEGNTPYAMFSCIIGAVINTVLCWLFIVVMGFDIRGAAYATVIGQVISCFVSLAYFVAGKSGMRFASFRTMKAAIVFKIIATGIASSVLQGLTAVINIIANHQLSAYGVISLGTGGGDLAISAVSVINTVETLMIMIIMGINQGVSPVISYNYGCGNYGRVRKATLFGQAEASAVTVIIWGLAMVFPQTLFAVFSGNDPQLMAYGPDAIHKSKMFLLFLGFQTLSSLYFSAIGKPKTAVCISVIRGAAFIIPLMYILPLFMGLDGVLYASSVSDLLATAIVAVIYVKGIKKLRAADPITEKGLIL